MGYDDLLHGLAGCWQLTRNVTALPDSGASDDMFLARMTGSATFSPIANSALPLYRYLEEGSLVMAGQEEKPFPFTRSYVYGIWERGLDIRFDDAERRPFQRLMLTSTKEGLEGEAEHFCAPDTYCSRYLFAMPSKFEITHSVKGPKKAHRIRTVYGKIDHRL